MLLIRIDAGGVVLAATQSPHEFVREKGAEIVALKVRNRRIQARLEKTEARLADLARPQKGGQR